VDVGYLLLAFVAVLAGTAFPIQAGINAGLGQHLGSPYWAAMASGAVLTFGVAALCTLILRLPSPVQGATDAPWWAWTGGLVGGCLLTTSIVLVPRLGGAVLIACVVLGEVLAALVLDHFGWLGYPREPLTMPRLAGAGMIVAGVALARLG
jgi:bacterial/archaeal transporter family-2 protein